MPTGYTAALYEGEDQTFEAFVLSCARAMGALVTMRDDAPTAPVPDEFAPTTYHLDALDKARMERTRLRAMSAAKAQVEADAVRSEWEAAQVAAEAQRVARKGRYQAMLDKVRGWEPPTPDHVGLRDFMVQQLEQSIDFDCSHYEHDAPTSDGPTWLANALGKAERDIEYHTAEHAKELERAAGRSAWVQALKASVVGRPVEVIDYGFGGHGQGETTPIEPPPLGRPT